MCSLLKPSRRRTGKVCSLGGLMPFWAGQRHVSARLKPSVQQWRDWQDSWHSVSCLLKWPPSRMGRSVCGPSSSPTGRPPIWEQPLSPRRLRPLCRVYSCTVCRRDTQTMSVSQSTFISGWGKLGAGDASDGRKLPSRWAPGWVRLGPGESRPCALHREENRVRAFQLLNTKSFAGGSSS